jgi:hypothetical protein
MALKISLVAGSGMIKMIKNSDPTIVKPSSSLQYELRNSTLTIFEKKGEDTLYLCSEQSNNIQDSANVTLASDAAVEAYLDPIIGVVKTV